MMAMQRWDLVLLSLTKIKTITEYFSIKIPDIALTGNSGMTESEEILSTNPTPTPKP